MIGSCAESPPTCWTFPRCVYIYLHKGAVQGGRPAVQCSSSRRTGIVKRCVCLSGGSSGFCLHFYCVVLVLCCRQKKVTFAHFRQSWLFLWSTSSGNFQPTNKWKLGRFSRRCLTFLLSSVGSSVISHLSSDLSLNSVLSWNGLKSWILKLYLEQYFYIWKFSVFYVTCSGRQKVILK